MNLIIDVTFIVVGLTLLAWSADKLVLYAVSLAKHLQISPFLIGIVIIGFGTSAPEMLVSALAAIDDVGGLAIGNALGSNIANIGLVLGFAALFSPLAISKKILKADLSVLFIITLLTVGLLFDLHLSTLDGIILASSLAGFLLWSAYSDKKSRKNNDSSEEDDEFDLEGEPEESLLKSSIWTLISLTLLLGSSKMLLDGAVGVSQALGISDLMIGLTVVAIGTSMPELAASIAAAKQKQTGLIIGNILGSNAFNTLGVLGIVGLLSDTSIDPEVLQRDFSSLFAIMILLTTLAFLRGRLGKLSGTLLLCSYFGYLGLLIYNALTLTA